MFVPRNCTLVNCVLHVVFDLLTANKVEGDSESECVDDKEACVMWAKHGYCESRPDVMNVKCRKSCRICSKSVWLRVLYNKQTL